VVAMTIPWRAEWRLWSYRLPLVRPLAWGGQRHTHREGLIVGLGQADGSWRYGEAAPLPGFTPETLAETRRDLLALAATGNPSAAKPGCARYAWESALAWGELPAVEIAANALLPEATAPLPTGVQVVKLKLDRPEPNAMAARVRTLCARLDPGMRVRVDANRLFAPGSARLFLRLLSGLPVDYVEEPARDWESLPGPAEEGPPLAVDETARERHHDGAPLRPRPAVWVCKPAWSGSLGGLLENLDRAARHARRVVFSSALETSLGVRNLAHFAVHSPWAGEAHGFDTANFFAEDLLATPPTWRDGRLHFPSGEPDFTRLHEIAHGHTPLPAA
jgi:O-succinylbenzoate synthase